MKNFFIICSVVIFLIQGCQSAGSKEKIASADSTYTITGKIAGLDTGWIYLFNRQVEPRKFDSVRINHGDFTFTGKADSPQYCLLGIPNAEHEKEYRLGFFRRSELSNSANCSILNLCSGITQRLAAPAMVGSMALNPAYLPKTSSTMNRSCEPAEVRRSLVM